MVGMMQQMGALPIVGPGAVAAGGDPTWGPTASSAGGDAGSPDENRGDPRALRRARSRAADDGGRRRARRRGRVRRPQPRLGHERPRLGARRRSATLRAAMPDLSYEVDTIEHGQRGQPGRRRTRSSAARTPASRSSAPSRRATRSSGRTATSSALDGGKIVERWTATDMLTLFQQAGVLPSHGRLDPLAPTATSRRSPSDPRTSRRRERRPWRSPKTSPLDDKANQWDRIVTADDATEIANKAIIARYVYATNIMDLDCFDGYVAEDYVEDEPIPGQEPGIEGLKEAYKIFAGAVLRRGLRLRRPVREGDLVFGRGEISGTNDGEFFGIPPTNKKISWTGTRLFRLKDNKVTHGWFNADIAGMLVQMGVAPAPPGPPPPDPPPVMPTGAPGHARGVQGDHAQADRRGLGEGQPRPRRRALPSRGDLPERADAAGRARGHEDDRADGARRVPRLLGQDRPDRRRERPRRRPHHAGRHAHRRVLRHPADRQGGRVDGDGDPAHRRREDPRHLVRQRHRGADAAARRRRAERGTTERVDVHERRG